MKLSQGVEWGLHCATLLAQVPPGGLMRRGVLAAHFGLPEAYLSKHLQAMTRAGVLSANSGPKGGYRLARAPESVSVLDVVEAIEGTAPPFVCQEIRQRGTGASSAEECRSTCLVNTVMNEADEAWRASLRSVTIAELVARLPDSVRTRNQETLTQLVH
ncbi:MULTISPECIES: Rrf2 family transcriptional regulator [unclassified Streptomyces]|uniref:RrF2 family transcriptional regulator n=1 Tax=unclassified Streptomyces TaxID=2593676 RepID=UPI002E15881A|nr:Rrf2 family transcriptional regulator [Streptomyces sp. NBC_01197]WSS52234.1 Rrf2 family transcriptional regulator [Streptomyces sp. NBC_01180]